MKYKRLLFLPIMMLACVFNLVGCGSKNDNSVDNSSEKQIPVYQGMVLSDVSGNEISASSFGYVESYANEPTGPSHGKPGGWHGGDTNKRNEDIDDENPFGKPDGSDTEEKVSSLVVVGSPQEGYYAEKNEKILITVKVHNPDSFEIMSFTLNGNKYSSYMFEDGSDLENLILKVDVGDVVGLKDYTIDAIKYIDGTEIKDVIMEGDKTVKVAVKADKEPVSIVSNQQIFADKISFNVNLSDDLSLISKSQGQAKVALYDGVSIIQEKNLVVGQNNIVFDNLKQNSLYEYVVIAAYDNYSQDEQVHILQKQAFYTDSILLFNKEQIEIGKTNANWGYSWNLGIVERIIVKQELFLNGIKVKDINVNQTTTDGLYSGKEYLLKTTYKDANNENQVIELSFITYEMAEPGIDITNVEPTKTSASFEIKEIDVDNIGTLTKLELLHGTDEPVNLDLIARKVENLLSNNNYKIKATYVYNLNDGTGDKQLVVEKEFKTVANVEPTIEITNIVPTKTSVTFEINETDADNIGILTKLELLHGTDAPINIDLAARKVENILSNNDYKVKATYVYDLNDGTGEKELVIEKEFKTIAKVAPTLEIKNLSSTKTSISFDYSINDADDICKIEKIQLLYEGVIVQEYDKNNLKKEFNNLEDGELFDIKVVYTYDLNDGNGLITKSVYKEYMTLKDMVYVTKFEIDNTKKVKVGDKIKVSFTISNPANMVLKLLKLSDGLQVSLHGISSEFSFDYEFVPETEGGLYELKVESVSYLYNNIELTQQIENISSSIDILGEITFLNITGSDEKSKENKKTTFEINIDNPTKYDISEVTINKVVHSIEDFEVVDYELIVLKYKGDYVIDGFYQVDSIKYGIKGDDNYSTGGIGSINCKFFYFNEEEILNISTADELQNMVNGNIYKLNNDINLADYDWKMYEFSGVLLGNNYKISNLMIEETREDLNDFQEFNFGLFEKFYGKVENLKIQNVYFTIRAGYNHADIGAFAGYFEGEAKNISISGNIDNISFTSYTGGFAGVIKDSLINNLYTTCYVHSDGLGNHVGGVAGKAINSKINNSFVTGSVVASAGYGDTIAAGIFAEANQCEVNGCIVNSKLTASVGEVEWMESTSFGIDIIGSVSSAENVIVDCWSFEGMEINADRKIIQATSTNMETIWQFVYDNWDDEVWNLSLSKNPTLKSKN